MGDEILNTFVDEIKGLYGENLVSVVLYGSRASGEDTKKHSDYNVLIVLDTVHFSDLSIDGVLSSWVRKGNPAPMLFSKEMFRNSSDVFPIDFLEIRDNHRILFGADPFEGLQIDDRLLRHECEYELKSKLLKLRQGYLLVHGKEKRVRDLLVDSLSSFLVVLRNVARLYGEVPPAKKLEALPLLAKHVEMDPAIFSTVMKMKLDDRGVRDLNPVLVMEEYMKQIEKVVDAVDKLGPQA